MGKKKQIILDIPVEFGGVSIGESTCRLGVRINRDVCNINTADEIFCGHRLTGKVLLGGSDDSPNQKKFLDGDEYSVEGSFDVKRIGVTVEMISTGLTFSLADIDVADLAKFSKGAGRLMVEGVGEIPDDAPNEHAEDKDQLDLRFDGDLGDVPLKKIFSGTILKGLLEGGLDNVRALADYTAANKDLTELPGIGPGKAEKITETMIEFHKQNKA